MYKINKIYYTLFIAVFLIVSACEKDEPTTSSATTDSRDQFVGAWKCNDKSNQGVPSFTITLFKDTSNQAYLRIYNFNNYGATVYAKAVANARNLTIYQQVVSGYPPGYSVEGSGQLLGSQLTLLYTVNDGFNPTENFNFLCIK